MDRFNTGDTTLTGAYLTGVTGMDIPDIIVVGILGKQNWRRHVLPNARKALISLLGRNIKMSEMYVWPLGNDEENNIRIFNDWQKYGKHIRIVLISPYEFKIYNASEVGE
jgi:hypothetical protein